MERKSIGSFISALRKSNGLTQKQLAEKLNVSDKAVSRWERDECAPDLSLIPVIAEIFNVTADELLCGERKTAANQESLPRRTQKQKKRILTQTMSKFKLQSLISFGITTVALIAAVIVEALFKNHYLTLFTLAVLIIASTVCEVIFLSNAVNSANDEEFEDIKTEQYKINAVNFSKILFAVNFALIFIYVSLLAFLPFCSGEISSLYDMLSAVSPAKPHNIFSPDIVLIELLYLGGGILLFKTIWSIVLNALKKTDFYPVDEKSSSLIKSKKRFLSISTVIVAVTLLISMGVSSTNHFAQDLFSQGIVYDDLEEFKEYIEEKTEPFTYNIEGLTLSIVSCDSVVTLDNQNPDNDYYTSQPSEQLLDTDGNVVFEYCHYNNNVRQLSFDPDTMTVTVYTTEELCRTEVMLRSILTMAVAFELLLIFTVYFVKFRRKTVQTVK